MASSPNTDRFDRYIGRRDVCIILLYDAIIINDNHRDGGIGRSHSHFTPHQDRK